MIKLKALEYDYIRIFKGPSYQKWDLAHMDRNWDENPRVLVFYTQWCQTFCY